MRLAIPVDPDADTAREWAEQELAKTEYQEGAQLSLDGFWAWLEELFARIGDAGSSLGVPGAVLVGIGVAAALALVVWLVLGPLRRSRRAGAAGAVFDDDGRPWRQIRDAAVAAQQAGDWDLAVMEWFRAGVRRELERGAIADSAGVTAREAATRIGASSPSTAQAVMADAQGFEGARYGSGGLTQADAEHAHATFEALGAARETTAAPA